MDKLISRASKLLVWGCESDRRASHQVLCSECTPRSVLQMGKGTGCDYYLIATGMNLVYQVPCVGCCKLLFRSVTEISISVVSPCRFPGRPCEVIIRSSHKLVIMPKVLWLSPSVLFSPWRLRGSLSTWSSTGLEEWHVKLLSYPSKVVCSGSLYCEGWFSFILVFEDPLCGVLF